MSRRDPEQHLSFSQNFSIWSQHHLQMAIFSLGRLFHTPLVTLLTATVIGIALALPAGLYLILHNVERLSGDWEISSSITLYLKPGTPVEQAQALAKRLTFHAAIAEVRYVSPTEAMEEFKHTSGFSGALDLLEENPLPSVIAIQPYAYLATPESAEKLRADLQQLPEVDIALLDLDWLQRFRLFSEIARRAVLLLGLLLALGVLLIVGNTIRLEIQNRRAEIEVTRLVGGTDAFIRRPFLYSGVWYGILGGVVAMALLTFALIALSDPVRQLAQLYQIQIDITAIPPVAPLLLIGFSVLLGWGGSWIGVQRHLKAIDPLPESRKA